MGLRTSEDKPAAEDAIRGGSFTIEVAGLGVRFSCAAGESLLRAMVAAGHRALAVGCRSGGCGVCRVQIISGTYSTGHMNRSVISLNDERSGLVLACRVYPQSDMTVEPRPVARQAGPIASEMAA